jgi:hypothetical protein
LVSVHNAEQFGNKLSIRASFQTIRRAGVSPVKNILPPCPSTVHNGQFKGATAHPSFDHELAAKAANPRLSIICRLERQTVLADCSNVFFFSRTSVMKASLSQP